MDIYGIIFWLLGGIVLGVETWLVWDIAHWIVEDITK